MTRYNPVDEDAKLRAEYADIRDRAVALARSKNFVPASTDRAAANRWFNGIVNQAMSEMGISAPTAKNYVITAKTVSNAFRAEPARAPGDATPLVLSFRRSSGQRGPEEIWEYTGFPPPKGGRWIIGTASTRFGHPSREAAEAVLERRRMKAAAQADAVQRILGHKGDSIPRWGLPITGASKKATTKYEEPLYAEIYREKDGRYDYPDVLRLLDRADEASLPLVVGLMRAMMDRQTSDEQTAEDALYANQLGFRKPDAVIAARLLAEYDALPQNPSDEQLISIHYRMADFLKIYARRQLPDVLQHHADHHGFALRTNSSRKSRRNPQPADVRWYQAILAMMRAIQWKAWTLHWQVSGTNYYGDHQLLQRMYEGKGGGPVINDSIDALGERMVAYFGPETVDAELISQQTSAILRETPPGFAGLLDLEMRLQKGIRAAWKMNQDAGDSFSLGMDDYLMGLSNERDTVIYLLKQRLRK